MFSKVSCQDDKLEDDFSAAESSENKDAFLLNQVKELADITYNLLKYTKLIETEQHERIAASKRSVMLPRIGGVKRSPVVFPRIGVEKKSAILQPRIGRDSPLEQDILDDKRSIVYQPRIGRK